MTETPSSPSGNRPGSKRKREPATLDLKATEVGTAPGEGGSSLVDDPRTPADIAEAASAADASAAPESMPDDPRAQDGSQDGSQDGAQDGPQDGAQDGSQDGAQDRPEPTPGEIEAAVERLIPEAGGRAGDADLPPAQDIAEAPPPEPGPGPDALDAASAMPARAAPEPKRRAGIGGLLAAAVLGGLVGAGLTAAAERYWPKSADPAGARMGQIEQRLAAVPRTDLNPLERRLSGLEGRQGETAEQAQAAQAAAEAARVAAEAARAAAEAARAAAERAAQQAARPADPGSTAPVAAGPDLAALPAALERIDARIAALEDEVRTRSREAAPPAQPAEDPGPRLADQAKRIEALAAQAAEQGRRIDAAAAQAAEQGQRFAGLGQQLGQRLAEQGERLDALARQAAERRPEATAGLRIVAADRVLDALRDGAPFPEALAALARLEADPQRLAALEPLARGGAPTASALSQEFRPVAQTILAEARGPAESWGERLSRMAEGIVTVRPAGEPGSATVPGLVARIDAALARGALHDAAAAWDVLPEPARQRAEAFGRRLKARAAADEAARAISNQALAALDAATR